MAVFFDKLTIIDNNNGITRNDGVLNLGWNFESDKDRGFLLPDYQSGTLCPAGLLILNKISHIRDVKTRR